MLLRVGLIGCGGRGTGAAAQALQADTNVKLVAMADAFADCVDRSLAALQNQEKIADKIDVPAERAVRRVRRLPAADRQRRGRRAAL